MNATFGNTGAEISGIADNFSLVALDAVTQVEENFGSIDGSRSISGTIADIDLEDDLAQPSLSSVS